MLGPGNGYGCPGPGISVTTNRLDNHGSREANAVIVCVKAVCGAIVPIRSGGVWARQTSQSLKAHKPTEQHTVQRASCRFANTYGVLAKVSRSTLFCGFQSLR